MNKSHEKSAGFAPILSADSVGAGAAPWELPSFDGLLKSRSPSAPPPPSAQQIEQIEAEAAREGHARGYADGYAQGAAAAREEVKRLKQLVAHLSAPIAEVDAQTEQALVALMLELARRLVQQELEADPVKVLGIVRDAVAHLAQPARNVRVRLNPADARVVAEHLETQGPDDDWKLVPDAKLMRGDCVVETDSGRVDARLDTRQAQLAQRLLGEGS